MEEATTPCLFVTAGGQTKMKILKKMEKIHFRIYVRDEKTKQTCSAVITDYTKLTKEKILDKIIDCLSKH